MEGSSFDVGAAAKVRFLVAPAVVSHTSRVRSLVRPFCLELSHARRAERVYVSVFRCKNYGKVTLNNKRTFSSNKTCLVISSRAS